MFFFAETLNMLAMRRLQRIKTIVGELTIVRLFLTAVFKEK